MGFALLNLTDNGQCESLEPWERVTRFPRFSFFVSVVVGNRRKKEICKHEKMFIGLFDDSVRDLCFCTKFDFAGVTKSMQITELGNGQQYPFK